MGSAVEKVTFSAFDVCQVRRWCGNEHHRDKDKSIWLISLGSMV